MSCFKKPYIASFQRRLKTNKNMIQLRDISYYQTGGSCSRLFEPESIPQLVDAMKEIHSTGLKYFLLGGGTNSLVMDEPWSGAVITFRRMSRIEVRGDVLYVEAGADNSAIARECLANSLSGAAWMNRLPGQIGGTIRMNARCYGGEISEIVRRVYCVSIEGVQRQYDDKSVFRGYKDTLFMDTGDVIAAAELHLSHGEAKLIKEKMSACESDRISKGQFLYPSCGCIFKNDYVAGVPSGMLLERAGVKGMSVGSAEVSPAHANFVFNKGCTSRDILELSIKMRQAVYDRFGVWLEYEMEILGDIPQDLQAQLKEKRRFLPSSALEEARRTFKER